jgi:hypothetical protein
LNTVGSELWGGRSHENIFYSLVATGFLITAFALGAPKSGYHLLNKYPFPAAEGRTREYFDYIAVDSPA